MARDPRHRISRQRVSGDGEWGTEDVSRSLAEGCRIKGTRRDGRGTCKSLCPKAAAKKSISRIPLRELSLHIPMYIEGGKNLLMCLEKYGYVFQEEQRIACTSRTVPIFTRMDSRNSRRQAKQGSGASYLEQTRKQRVCVLCDQQTVSIPSGALQVTSRPPSRSPA